MEPAADLEQAWAVARGGAVARAARRVLGELAPGVRELLVDGAGGRQAAADALAVHAVEALVAERLVRREGGAALARTCGAADDPAALVWRQAEKRAAGAAVDRALDGLEVPRDAALFPGPASARARKRRGGVYTRAHLAEQLLDLAGWDGQGRLLEPACGEGAFLFPAWRRALAAGADPGHLVGVDVHPFACRAARTALARHAARAGLSPEALPRVVCEDALDPRRGGPTASLGAYELVIGNPPYVRGERLPAARRARYRALAPALGQGNVDLVAYFVERALRWVRPGGRVGLVVPQGVFEARSTRGLRRLLAQHALEAAVTLEWSPGVFPDANVIPCLLVVRRAAPPARHRVWLGSGRWASREATLFGDEERALCLEGDRVAQRSWLELAVDGRWPLGLRRGDLGLLRALRGAPTPLQAGYGLAIRTRVGAASLIAEGPAPAEFAAPRPLIDGRDVRPWRIGPSGRVLDYRPEAISDPKSEAFFRAPKVVLPRIALTLAAAVDRGDPEPLLARNTVMVVRAPGTLLDEAPDGPDALAAVLNALPVRLYAFLLLRAGVLAGSHRATFYAGVLGAVPVPAPLLEDEARLVRLAALSRAAAAAASRGDAQALGAAEAAVDAAVGAAFGLDERAQGRLRARAAEPPFAAVLAPPRAPARRIAVQSYAAGARYR